MDTYKVEDLGANRALHRKIASLVKEHKAVNIKGIGVVNEQNIDVVCGTIRTMFRLIDKYDKKEYIRRTEEEDLEVLDYAEKYSVKEASEKFKVATSTISNLRRKYDRLAVRKRTKEEDLEILEYYMSHSLKETSEKFGIPETTINNMGTKYGMRKNKKRTKKKKSDSKK